MVKAAIIHGPSATAALGEQEKSEIVESYKIVDTQMKTLEQQKRALERRKKEQMRRDGYLLDDPGGSGQQHSDKMWAEIYAEEASIAQEELAMLKKQIADNQPHPIP